FDGSRGRETERVGGRRSIASPDDAGGHLLQRRPLPRPVKRRVQPFVGLPRDGSETLVYGLLGRSNRMTRRLICSAGIATILAFAWGQPAHAQDYAPNGWIRTDAWKLLYISTSCGAGGETCAGCGNPQGFFAPGHADVNWVAPHNIGTEDPMVGESWEDITPAAAGTNGPGEFRGGTTWETTATLGAADILGDVVDHDAILARLGLNTDNVYGIAITYVENVSGAPLLVQICSASDDSIQVWVNDVLAQSNSACRGTAGDCAETALVQIPTGVSKIVTITHEGGGGFGFRFALRRAGVRLADGNGLIEFLGPSDD